MEEDLINRLYKEDVHKRKYKKELMNEMFKPIFIPNYKPDNNIMKKNRNLVYEKLLGNEEGIDEHSEITKQLKENLHNEESKELVRNKIFKNRKKAYNSNGKNMKFARLSQINEELDKELEKKNNNKIK